MNLDPATFLRLAEKAKALCFLDLEASGLRGDFNSIYVISVKPFQSDPKTFSVSRPGDDRKIIRDAKAYLETFDCWVTYYGRGYDIKMIDTRALRHEQPPLVRKPHIDMYYVLRANLLTARRSQGHLLSWLGTKESKLSVSADIWAKVPVDPKDTLPVLIKRCESDVLGLEELYMRTRHLIRDIKH